MIFRKIHNWHTRLRGRIRISYYYHISKHRFTINSNVFLGKGFSIQSDISLTSVIIKDHCRFRNYCNILMGQGGKLTIGENCFFNNNCSVNCFSEINIGNNNQFGEGVKMYDHNHNFREKGKLINEQGYSCGQIKIGNNCWVGSNVVILKGVEIGDNVIIGAGCVIHKSVPGNTMIVNKQSLEVSPYGNQP